MPQKTYRLGPGDAGPVYSAASKAITTNHDLI